MPRVYAGKTVGQRIKLCDDLMGVRADAQALTGVNAVAGKVILNQRAAAVRRLLGATGDTPAEPFDDLLSPASANDRLQAMADQLQALPEAQRISQSEQMLDLGRMMAALANAQHRLGIRTPAPKMSEPMRLSILGARLDSPGTGEQVHGFKHYDALRGANMLRGAVSDEDAAAALLGAQELEAHNSTSRSNAFPEMAAQLSKVREAAIEKWAQVRATSPAGGDSAEYDRAFGEYQSLQDDFRALDQSMIDAYNARTQQIKDSLAQHGEKHLQRVLDASPVTPEQARAWADAQEISKTATARLTKIGYPAARVRADMAEFYRLSGGRLPSIKIDSKGDRRANAAGIGEHGTVGAVFLDGDFDKRVLFHEMAHHLESDPAMFKASANYIRWRATSQEPVPLRNLAPGANYRADEKALPGEFYSPYVGKLYASATEVMSMGLEVFAEPWRLGYVMGKDPQTLAFASGAVMAQQGDAERMHAKMRAMLADINGDAKENQAAAIAVEWARLAASVTLNKVTVEQAAQWFERNTYYGRQYRKAIEDKKIGAIGTMINGGDLGDQALIVSEMVKNERTGKRLKGYQIHLRNGAAMWHRPVADKDVNAALAMIALYLKNGVLPYFVQIDTLEGLAKL